LQTEGFSCATVGAPVAALSEFGIFLAEAHFVMSTHEKSRTILVVDDNFLARESLAVLLRLLSFTVSTAADGVEALDYLRSHPAPCLIILDLWMPRMGGREFLAVKAADAALAPIPVFVVSAVADRETGLPQAGVKLVETKPVDVERLVAALERYCPQLSGDA
jgi:CheY-like chemotaxis protein